MDIIDCIKTRRSVRRFQNTKIPEQVLYTILDAANQAPCAGGLQTWRFLVVEEEKGRQAVAKAALRQDWISSAPVIVLLCSEPKQLAVEFGKRALELYDAQNTSMAAENLMLAAWNFGIGSTFVSAFVETQLRTHFKIPAAIHIHGIIPLGYPAEAPLGIARVATEDLTYFEEWGNELKSEFKVISGIVYPEKYEVRLGEEAEKLAREVVGKVKKEVRKRLPKKKAKGRKK